ncbi:hypothetical protein ACJ41O_003544 [Fusarium nematophilum]
MAARFVSLSSPVAQSNVSVEKAKNSTARSAAESHRIASEYEFSGNQVWVEVPVVLEWIEIHDPYTEAGMETSPSQRNGAGAVRSNGTQHPPHSNGVGAVHSNGAQQAAHSNGVGAVHSNGAQHAVHRNAVEEAEETGQSEEEDGSGSERGESLHSFEDDEDEDTRQRIEDLLIRHYKQHDGPGSWMDLSYPDSGSFFSSTVPDMASNNPMLKSAMCALAAQHVNSICTHLDQTVDDDDFLVAHHRWPAVFFNVDWYFQSAKKHYEAITLLKEAVEHNRAGEEDVLAADAICQMYESLDTPGASWHAGLGAEAESRTGDA